MFALETSLSFVHKYLQPLANLKTYEPGTKTGTSYNTAKTLTPSAAP